MDETNAKFTIFLCMKKIRSIRLVLLLLLVTIRSVSAQTRDSELIGYFHNWQDGNAPYIELDKVDSNYTIIDVAFALPKSGTDYNLRFVPDRTSKPEFISQIKRLQSAGKKILISIGGATAPISLSNKVERDTFVVSMNRIIDDYGFDGMDIDIEGTSLSVTGGSIAKPEDGEIIHLISAIQMIMKDYHKKHGRRLILTMSPETAFVQGGQSSYGGIWGAYLPVVHALRDSIEILHTQLYNSGTMYGVDGKIYSQGSADFIIAMTEAVIHGFNTSGGYFEGLSANQVAVGLPACSKGASGGYTKPETVRSAINYILGKGPKPGNYELAKSGGYPELRGMMTWSINWDALSTCGTRYEYASLYKDVFGQTPASYNNAHMPQSNSIFPNPTSEILNIRLSLFNQEPQRIEIRDLQGLLIDTYSDFDSSTIAELDVSELSAGIYVLIIHTDHLDIQKRFVKVSH